MTYVIPKANFAAPETIQELSFDEIAHIGCSAGRSLSQADVVSFTDWFLGDLSRFLTGSGDWDSVVNSWTNLWLVVNVVYPR